MHETALGDERPWRLTGKLEAEAIVAFAVGEDCTASGVLLRVRINYLEKSGSAVDEAADVGNVKVGSERIHRARRCWRL